MSTLVITAALVIMITILLKVWKFGSNRILTERRRLRTIMEDVYALNKALKRRKIRMQGDLNISLPAAIKEQLQQEVNSLDKCVVYCTEAIGIIEKNKAQIKHWAKVYKLSQEYMKKASFAHKYQLSSSGNQFVKMLKLQDCAELANSLNKMKVSAEKDRHAETVYIQKHIQKISGHRASSINIDAYTSLYSAIEVGKQTA